MKINNIMSTTIDINTIKASNSLKSLDSAIRATTNAWKANEARAKSVGSSLEAAKSRYAGLGKNIDNVKSKIKYLTEQQSKLDTSTKQGQEEYNKYVNKLASAEKQLASMTAQQDRAKKAMDYQKSGLAGLQSSYKLLNQLGQSRVERLKAEGKEYEANKTQLSTYRNSITSLTKQQQLQAKELTQIAKTSGEASEAYKRQQIRLNQTSTALAKTKSNMNELSGSMRKANPTFFDKLKTKIGGMNKEAETTHKTFKEVFMGSALGNALSNAVSNVTGKLKGAVTEGMNLNAAVAKINGRFKSMGMSDRFIKKLDDQIGELKSQTNMTGDNVANLQTRMLNWSNVGRKGAMQMTKMIAGVGDSSKLSGDKVEQLGAQLMRIGSTGKVTYSSLSRITKAAPTFMAQLAKGAGVSESKLKAMLKSGKVTQTQFQKWMVSAGKYSDEAFKGFGKTQGGALKYMQVRWQKLESTMTKPLFDAKTSGLQSLKDIMSSPELLKGATAIGNALSATIGYIDKHKKDIAGITSDITHIGVAIGKDVWKDFAGIVGDIGKSFGLVSGNSKKSQDPLHMVKLTLDGLAKNKTAIQWISKAIVAMAAVKGMKAVVSPLNTLANLKVGKSSLIGLLVKGGLNLGKGLLHPIKTATNATDKFTIGLSNVKTKFGKITDGFKTGFNKIGDAGSKAWNVIQKGWSKASDLGSRAGKAIAKGFRTTGNALAKAGKWSWNKIKSGFSAAKSFGQTLAKKFVAGFKATVSKTKSIGKGLFTQKGGAGAFNGLLQSSRSAGGFKNLTTAGKIGTTAAGVGVAVDAATSIVKGIKDKIGSRKQYEDIGTGAGKAIGGGIGLYFGGPLGAAVGAKIGSIVGKWGGDAVKNFQNGWNKKKPPKKFWSLENLGWSTHDTFTKIGKWGQNVGKKFGQGLKKGKSFAKKNSKELALTAVSPLLGIPALLYKNNPKFRKWANGVGKSIKGGLKTASKSVNNFRSSISKNFKKAWNQAYKHSSKGTKQIMRSVSKFGKNYVKTNKKASQDTIKNFSSFSTRLKKNHGNLFKTIGQTAKTQLNIEKKRWSSNWKNIKSTANGIWKGLNSNASGMYKKLNTATHGGLDKVFGGFKSFGKSVKDFWNGLWKGITKTFDDTIKNLKNAAGNVKKFFTGKLKVGNIHLASGTDWRKRWGYPAILNDGNDSPQTGNREGLIHTDGSVEVLNGRYIKRWIFPGQEIINAHDLANLFGRGVHLANGTFDLRNLKSVITIKDPSNLLKDLNKITKKSYELNKKKYSEAVARHDKQKQRHYKNDQNTENERKRFIKQENEARAERSKLEREIRANLKKGKSTKSLVKQLNALDDHISKIKKDVSKTNPHHGQTLVDEGLLIGAKSRIGKSKWISTSLFKKLIDNLNKKNKKTKKKKTEKRKTKRRSTSSTRTTSSRSSSVSIPRISSQHISVKASVSGLSSVKSLATAISAVKSKSVKISAKGSSAKSINSLAKAVNKIKGGTHKVTVKVRGIKAVNSLYKATKKIKGKTHKVTVKTSGTKGLKSLQSHISSVTKRVKSLNSAAKKSKFGKEISKQAESAVKSLKGKGNFAKQFKSMTKKFDKDLKSMTHNAKKEFSTMWSTIEKSSNGGKTKILNILSGFSHRFTHDWKSLENGVHSTFSRFWSSMDKAAGQGVNAVIRILNNAIGKIDSVIADFGGSKHAVSKVSLVKYATGTGYFGSAARRAITKPTLAVLNDGHDSPETGNREGIYDKSTGSLSVVNGTNVPFLLGPQHEVFNATEMRELGATQHFATGTGYLKKLYETAKHNWSHPTKTGQDMFGAVSGLTGAIKELAQGMRSKGEDQGIAWWSQLWKMVENKVNDGSGDVSGLLKEAIKVSKGHRYVWGAKGPDTFDCSGLVEYAARKLGINLTAPSGNEYSQVEHISRSEARMNDLVFYGSEGGKHVGIVKDKNTYWSAHSPSSHPNIGYDSIDDAPAHPILFGRIRGYHPKDDKSENVKANTALQKKIRAQVGKGFWKVIQKIADKYGDNGMAAAFKLGGDIGARAKALAKALKQAVPGATKNGLAGVIGSWEFESGGLNPAAINPNGGASGLGQWLGGRLTNLKAYARRHHKSWTDPATQINFAVNEEGSDSAILRRILKSNASPTETATAFSREWERGGYDAQHASAARQIVGWLKGYANGGIVSSPQLAMVGEGAAPETIIPWDISKRSRAYQLLGATLAKFKVEDGQNASYNYVDQERQKEEHDFMQAVLLLLRQIAAKSGVADIKLTTPQGRTLWEVIEPFSKAEQHAALIKLRRGLSGR